MFVLNPDPYLLPAYLISPFTTADVTTNCHLPVKNGIDNYLSERFGGKRFVYTENGRKAIALALSYYDLNETDVVTILTTSGNFYISGCVTSEIEKVCSWSREIVPETKLLFVNHEFGFPYPDVQSLKKYNLPIIEDCAHTFWGGSQSGTVGDFVVYSFPKAFPIQTGGLLRINVSDSRINYKLNDGSEQYIKNVLSAYINDENDLKAARLKNYCYLESQFQKMGFPVRFALQQDAVPGVFMFRIEDERIDLNRLKICFNGHGIQSSVFYGERAFFIPCHHRLTETDMDYFVAVMQYFLNTEVK